MGFEEKYTINYISVKVSIINCPFIQAGILTELMSMYGSNHVFAYSSDVYIGCAIYLCLPNRLGDIVVAFILGQVRVLRMRASIKGNFPCLVWNCALPW